MHAPHRFLYHSSTPPYHHPGLGPVIVAALIGGLGRTRALNIASLFWAPCGLLVLLAAFTLVRDEEAVQERLRRVVEAQAASGAPRKGGCVLGS